MRVDAVELRRVGMALVAPFGTASGVEHHRDVLLVRVEGVAEGPTGPSDVEGWGECAVLAAPTYTEEYVAGAEHVIGHHLLPRLAGAPEQTAAAVGPTLAGVAGHRAAKAAIETAVLDAELRAAGAPLARHLGGTRAAVACGVAVGLHDDLGALLDVVAAHVEAGYRRVKLKIQPGADVAPVRAVREAHPDLALQVDANGSYEPGDWRRLAELDAYDLLLVEQPLASDDLAGHVRLAGRLRTPICLDESIRSAREAALAVSLGACAVVNVKAGRVGGYLEARRVHDVCRAAGVPVWCGGMLETGLGRAANLALASLPGFTLPGDLAASDRYFHRDLTAPFVLDGGTLPVPTGPGLGVTPLPEVLAEVTTSTTTHRLADLR